jgi:hypothetical protein
MMIISIAAGISDLRKSRLMERTSKINIVDLKPGIVEVEGLTIAIPGKEVIGPLSKKKCIKYRIVAQELKVMDEDRSRWVDVYNEWEGDQFLLDDGTGIAFVDPAGNEEGMKPSYHAEQKHLRDMEDPGKQFLLDHGIEMQDSFSGFNKRMKISERILPIGKFLYILGDAQEIMRPKEARDIPYLNALSIVNDGRMIISKKPEERTEMLKRKSARFEFIFAGVCIILFVLISLILLYMYV